MNETELLARIGRQVVEFDILRTEYSRLFNILKAVKEGKLNVCQIELGNDSWKINELPTFETDSSNGEVPQVIQDRLQ